MLQGCSGLSRAVPGVFRGCSGGVPGCSGVFRGVPGCSGSVPGFTDTHIKWSDVSFLVVENSRSLFGKVPAMMKEKQI